MADLERILYFIEESFGTSSFPDYPYALNGLQVDGPREVRSIGAAVDASEATIREAVRLEADLLLVHHGLFWGGLGPITGPRYRKVEALIQGGVGLYSLHLPLDAHEEFGNNAILLKRLGLSPEGRFGAFKEAEVGWWGTAAQSRGELEDRMREAVEGEIFSIHGGPEAVSRVGVVTGGGSSALTEAAFLGLDTLITGEAPHHAYHEAMELGVNLILGGHYATETFGVKALAAQLAHAFDLSWDFLHFPTGL